MAVGHAHRDLIPPLAAVLARRCTAAAVVEPMASLGLSRLAEAADLSGTTHARRSL